MSRSDDSVVADFVLGDLKETIRTIEAAWRDHRKRKLRPIDGEKPEPWDAFRDDRYGCFGCYRAEVRALGGGLASTSPPGGSPNLEY